MEPLAFIKIGKKNETEAKNMQKNIKLMNTLFSSLGHNYWKKGHLCYAPAPLAKLSCDKDSKGYLCSGKYSPNIAA